MCFNVWSSSSLSKSPRFSSTESILSHFLINGKHSDFTRSVMEKTKSAFCDLPKNLFDISEKSKDLILSIGYRFMPGIENCIPVDGLLFSPIESYDCFIRDPNIHVQPGFDKITLVENGDNILPKIASAYTKDQPFIDIQIPSETSGRALMGVSLGLAVIILLSLGISPNVNDILS